MKTLILLQKNNTFCWLNHEGYANLFERGKKTALQKVLYTALNDTIVDSETKEDQQ
jgi:hypothetical protein